LELERSVDTKTGSSVATTTEAVFRRDRAIILAGLIAVTALAWAYMFYLAARMGDMSMSPDMTDMTEMAAPQMRSWGIIDLVLMFIMWSVMMVAMMVPSAAPMILVFAKVQRNRQSNESPFAPTSALVLGYLLVWTAFSAIATLTQWGFHSAALLSPMMMSTSPLLGGGLLVAAGIFQWTPLKRACLVHCRSPLHFFMTEWRDGATGALQMGGRHGAYCVGCCWVLMALLFVAGVMNLLWVAAIAAFVLIEKMVPRGEIVGRAFGVALIAAGLTMVQGIV